MMIHVLQGQLYRRSLLDSSKYSAIKPLKINNFVVEKVQLLSQKSYPTCGRVGEHHEEKTHHGLKAVRMP